MVQPGALGWWEPWEIEFLWRVAPHSGSSVSSPVYYRVPRNVETRMGTWAQQTDYRVHADIALLTLIMS